MQKNNETIELFDQANAEINKLFWLATCIESSELKGFLQELEKDAWEDMLPEVANNEFFDEYQHDDELSQLLIEMDKLGFIAEVTIAECDGFTFNDEDEVTTGSIHPGIRHIRYVYAETSEELIEKAIKVGEEEYEKDITRFKKKNSIPQ